MVAISNDTELAIYNELREAYIAKFGDTWVQNLTRNLRPSPVKELAVRYGVSLKRVQEIKHKLWLLGVLIQSLPADSAGVITDHLTGNIQTTLEEPPATAE